MNYFQKLINFAYKLYLPLPIRSSYFLYFSYLNIFFGRTVHWILVPWSGIEPMPLQWPALSPGPSGKPLCPLFPQQWHTAAGLCSVKANCLWPHGPQQAPLSMGVPRQGHWSGLPFLLQRIFLTQGLNPCLWCLLHWQVDFFFLTTVPPGKPNDTQTPLFSPIVLPSAFMTIIHIFLKLKPSFTHLPSYIF